MKAYVRTAKSHPWRLPPVENALKNLGLDGGSDVSKLDRTIRAPDGRPISDDEMLVAFNALCDLGVLKETARATASGGRNLKPQKNSVEAFNRPSQSWARTATLLHEAHSYVFPSRRRCRQLLNM